MFENRYHILQPMCTFIHNTHKIFLFSSSYFQVGWELGISLIRHIQIFIVLKRQFELFLTIYKS